MKEKNNISCKVIEKPYSLDSLIDNSCISDEVFSIVMYDESMEPRISKGDFLIFESQDMIEDNALMLLLVEKRNVVFRRVHLTVDNILLHALNSAFADVTVNFKNVCVLGKCIEARHIFD